MGTRRSKYNYGRKPIYEERRLHFYEGGVEHMTDAEIAAESDLPWFDPDASPPPEVSQLLEKKTLENTELISYPGIFHESHVNAIRLLQINDMAPVPTGMCHGVSLAWLAKRGYIERSLFEGLWQATDAGREINLGTVRLKNDNNKNRLPYEPEGATKNILLDAYGAIDGLQPGSIIFNKVVRRAALDHLFGKPRHQKFAYFAYPEGYLLRWIGLTASMAEGRKPTKSWGDLEACQWRAKAGLPAMRMRPRKQQSVVIDPTDGLPIDAAFYRQLLEEGCSPQEISEYYGISQTRAII